MIMFSNSWRSLICLSGLTAVLASAACTPPVDPAWDMMDSQMSEARIDTLARALTLVASPERYQLTQFEEKLSSALSRWAHKERELESVEAWSSDPLAATVIDEYRSEPITDDIEEFDFVITDSYFVQQSYWCKRLVDRLIADRQMGPYELYQAAAGLDAPSTSDAVPYGSVEERESPDLLALSLEKLHDLSFDDANRLAQAVRVFDWVIRNVQLLPDDELTADEPNLDRLKLNTATALPAAGVPGLGYTRFPWQTLLFSRGDYVERAKLFMAMIDQLEIDSVMLVPQGNSSQQPWAVGVSVAGELFLFDPRLGLPIPGKALGQIATLSSVQSDPQLLKSLDLTVEESLQPNTQYWVQAEQLTPIVGLILAGPESLSNRFWQLENKLVGDQRMKLTCEPTSIVERLPKMDGLQYQLWDIEFKTHQFRRALRDAIAAASFKDDIRDKIRWYFLDEFYIYEFVRYRTARSKYFHGLFETVRNDRILNAIELFYTMIYKDSKIDSLATDGIFQYQLSLNQGTQSADEYQRLIAGVQANMRLVRRDSGFFLAQCHFENGNYSTAENWLTRLEQIEDTARWQPAINYLRGRSLEAQRDYDSAIEVYRKQSTEQFHGELIRVRMLKALAAKYS